MREEVLKGGEVWGTNPQAPLPDEFSKPVIETANRDLGTPMPGGNRKMNGEASEKRIKGQTT